jgi:hypothetical protein
VSLQAGNTALSTSPATPSDILTANPLNCNPFDVICLATVVTLVLLFTTTDLGIYYGHQLHSGELVKGFSDIGTSEERRRSLL